MNIESIRSKVSKLESDLNVAVANKQITIVDLSINNTIPKKGEDILNRLIFNYVQENLTDKNEVADSTIAFINRRLMIISSELGSAEANIESFKQKNNLADMSEQGRLLVATSGQNISELAKTETQISIVISLLEQLKDGSNDKRVLPSGLATQDIIFSGAIEKYNTLVLERGRKLIGLSASNPVILNLDKEIANARTDIVTNLESTLNGLKITRNKINVQMAGTEKEIRQVPATERNYLKLARQQQIKQELFIFLMQKSEETAISKTANIANSKTIDPPQAEIIPFAPKKMNIYVFSLGIGLFMPLAFFYLKDLLNDKVGSKEEVVKHANVSVIGEISHNHDVDNLVVANRSRSPIAEQFRALRTNLSFYLRSSQEKVILITSSMSGEGKSFCAINLGNILALSGKKVCLVELDLRKPGLSSKLGIKQSAGFTNYIISNAVETVDIIKPLAINENLYIISSGPLPPNPAETILNPRTGELLLKLKEQFDYIIIDAPPIGIVTDAQLLANHADICLYLVRQNYTRREQLDIVKNLRHSNKMKQLAVVINDIPPARSYGYAYGYGYGEYGQEEQKSRYWKI